MNHEPFSFFHHYTNLIILLLYDDTLQQLGILHASLTCVVLQQKQNLGQRFGTSNMHLGPLLAFAVVCPTVIVLMLFNRCSIVTPLVGFCNCYKFYCALLSVHSSLQSSRSG